jgi:hypothetical protein
MPYKAENRKKSYRNINKRELPTEAKIPLQSNHEKETGDKNSSSLIKSYKAV